MAAILSVPENSYSSGHNYLILLLETHRYSEVCTSLLHIILIDTNNHMLVKNSQSTAILQCKSHFARL